MILLIGCLLLTGCVEYVDDDSEWVNVWGGEDAQGRDSPSWLDHCNAVEVDNRGFVYVTGRAYDDQSNSDQPGSIFLSKLDSEGGIVWEKTWGGSKGLSGDLALDGDGYIYVTGSYVDPDARRTAHPNVFLREGVRQAFLMKFRYDGQVVWEVNWEIWDYQWQPYELEVGQYIYVAGEFGGKRDFDPSPAIVERESFEQNIFISAFTSDGEFSWVKIIESDELLMFNALSCDSNSNIYMTGVSFSTTDFDPGPDVVSFPYTYYLLKLDGDGIFQWVQPVANHHYRLRNPVTTDSLGRIYLAGCFYGEVDFDPGEGEAIRIAESGLNAYICILDSDGNFESVITWGNGVGEYPSVDVDDIFVSSSNEIYITGSFRAKVDFDPGPDDYRIEPSSYDNSYALWLDPGGKLRWFSSWQGNVYGLNSGEITADSYGNVYVCGKLSFITEFNLDDKQIEIEANGVCDGYLLKLHPESTM